MTDFSPKWALLNNRFPIKHKNYKCEVFDNWYLKVDIFNFSPFDFKFRQHHFTNRRGCASISESGSKSGIGSLLAEQHCVAEFDHRNSDHDPNKRLRNRRLRPKKMNSSRTKISRSFLSA